MPLENHSVNESGCSDIGKRAIVIWTLSKREIHTGVALILQLKKDMIWVLLGSWWLYCPSLAVMDINFNIILCAIRNIKKLV